MTSSPAPRKKSAFLKSKPAWAPHGYQKRAVQFLLERGAGALFLEPGLGKTSVTLATLKILKRDGQLTGALIVAPLRVAKLVWPAEAAKWADFEDFSVGVLHGPHKDRVLDEEHDIYVINYEGLPWLFSTKLGGAGKRQHVLTPAGEKLLGKVNVLVFDELTRMKNRSTQRFKLIEPWLHKFHRRYGLTGSPAPNGLLDLFGQCYALDLGRSLGKYITRFREEYFRTVDRMGYVWEPKTGAAEAIYERLKPLVLSMRAEDHLELPKLRNFPLKFDVPAKHQKRYKELEDDLITVLSGGDVVRAKNAAAGNNLCRQFCNGFVYEDKVDLLTGQIKGGKRGAHHLFDDKLEVLGALIEELNGKQLLVAYEFKEDRDRLAAAFPTMRFFGGKDDAALEALWNAGELQLLAGNPQSMGHGLNLQGSNAHNICWFTLPWNFEYYMQFIDRLLRQGNKAAYINNYMIVARKTVEERVMAVLAGKDRTESALKKALVDTEGSYD